MKIVILTLPFHSNYGGILQAYALQTVLQRLGHEVVVLDKDSFYHRSWFRQQIAFWVYLLRKYVLRQQTMFVDLRGRDRQKRTIEKNTRRFLERHVHPLMVKDLERDFPKNVDAVIVGSDQVWRPKYFGAFGCGIENAFLSFAADLPIKRYAYAASFGTGEWEYTKEETGRCSQLLKLFDAVSVREESAVELCREKLAREDVVRMPDPTLLLVEEDYRSLFMPSKVMSGHVLLYYVLDKTEEIEKLANRIARERNLAVKIVNSEVQNTELQLSCRIQPPVEDWLRGFSEADFVVTDSFHACVFSIIFDKPFVVIGNQDRGMDRFQSLLSVFDLPKNLILSPSEYDSGHDYAVGPKAREIWMREKERAWFYLRDCVNIIE